MSRKEGKDGYMHPVEVTIVFSYFYSFIQFLKAFQAFYSYGYLHFRTFSQVVDLE